MIKRYRRLIVLSLIVGLFVFFGAEAYARVIRVPLEYPTIQDAILAAQNRDTILVDPGLYYERINFLGKAITVQSVKGADTTIIDAQNTGSCVVFANGEGRDSILQGFTLTNGIGTMDPYTRSGGGIYCEGTSPTIKENTIKENRALSGYGGGIFLKSDSAPLITQNTIEHNFSSHCGGGIYVRSSSPDITHNVIRYNEATEYGGGIVGSLSSSLNVVDNTITENLSESCGGGITVYSSSGVVAQNDISKNISSTSGGGVCLLETSSVVMNSNTIADNLAQDGGGGIYSLKGTVSQGKNNTITQNTSSKGGGLACYGAKWNVSNTIFWGNSAQTGKEVYLQQFASAPSHLTIDYSDVETATNAFFIDPSSTVDVGEGMIYLDPDFEDAQTGQYALKATSPAIETGHPDDTVPPYGGDRIDIGSQEKNILMNDQLLFFYKVPRIIEAGSLLKFDASLYNPSSIPVTVDVRFDYVGEDQFEEIITFKEVTIAPYERIDRTITEKLSALGKYTVRGIVVFKGTVEDIVVDIQSFLIEVIP